MSCTLNKFTAVREVLCNNYQSCKLVIVLTTFFGHTQETQLCWLETTHLNLDTTDFSSLPKISIGSKQMFDGMGKQKLPTTGTSVLSEDIALSCHWLFSVRPFFTKIYQNLHPFYTRTQVSRSTVVKVGNYMYSDGGSLYPQLSDTCDDYRD